MSPAGGKGGRVGGWGPTGDGLEGAGLAAEGWCPCLLLQGQQVLVGFRK